MGSLRLLRAADRPPEAPTLADLWARDGLPVETGPVRLEPVQGRVRLFGTARGTEQVEVICPSPNILEALHVKVGDPVRQGQLLVSMREVSLSPLGYPYAPLEAKKEALDQDAARMEALRAREAITAQDYDHFQAERRATEAQFASARAVVKLTAPISGTVTRIDFRVGEMVPNDRPLLQVARLDTMEVTLMAEASDVAHLAEGQGVEVRSSARPGLQLQGTVVERALGSHPLLNQFRVRVRVDNPTRDLLPGFPIEAVIRTGSPEPALSVPRESLVTREGQTGVWKVGPGPASLFVPVVAGASDGARVAVQGDLSEGDAVVTLGQDHLARDGQPLRTRSE